MGAQAGQPFGLGSNHFVLILTTQGLIGAPSLIIAPMS
jgi:hypothetical protein